MILIIIISLALNYNHIAMSRTWSVAHVLSRVSQRGTKIGLNKEAEINFDTVLALRRIFSVHVSLAIWQVHPTLAWIFSLHERYSRVTKNQKVTISNALEIRHLVPKFDILFKKTTVLTESNTEAPEDHSRCHLPVFSCWTQGKFEY